LGKLANILIKNKINVYFWKVTKYNFMNRIGELLNERGLKQKWLAEQIEMSNVMVNLYVRNKRQPRLETLIKISKTIGVEIEQLIVT
jgi:transcriptional regulator with XRE-family HTH domain